MTILITGLYYCSPNLFASMLQLILWEPVCDESIFALVVEPSFSKKHKNLWSMFIVPLLASLPCSLVHEQRQYM